MQLLTRNRKHRHAAVFTPTTYIPWKERGRRKLKMEREDNKEKRREKGEEWDGREGKKEGGHER